MTFRIRFVDDLPDPDAYRTLMVDFFRGIAAFLAAAGGPEKVPEQLADATLAHVAETLPPRGGLAFAHDGAAHLLGTGAFRLLGRRTAEFKRMYVRPEAQRMGLGRRLREARIAEVRAIGCNRIFADTVRGNAPMLQLYERYGFRHVPRHEGNFNSPELDPFLHYLELILPDDEAG